MKLRAGIRVATSMHPAGIFAIVNLNSTRATLLAKEPGAKSFSVLLKNVRPCLFGKSRAGFEAAAAKEGMSVSEVQRFYQRLYGKGARGWLVRGGEPRPKDKRRNRKRGRKRQADTPERVRGRLRYAAACG